MNKKQTRKYQLLGGATAAGLVTYEIVSASPTLAEGTAPTQLQDAAAGVSIIGTMIPILAAAMVVLTVVGIGLTSIRKLGGRG